MYSTLSRKANSKNYDEFVMVNVPYSVRSIVSLNYSTFE